MEPLPPNNNDIPGEPVGGERGLLVDLLAAALVEVGLGAPSDTLLTPVARALLSMTTDKGVAHAATE